MKNVFLIGKAGVGKDTIAAMMYDQADIRRVALAKPIKDECQRWARRWIDKSDRALLIEFGESFRRWFGAGVWCEIAWDRIEQGWHYDDTYFGRNRSAVVITDGRHLVEYDYFVVQRGFVPVRIVADDDVRFARLLTRDGVDQRAVLHGQETELDGVEVSVVIDNNGDVEALKRQVEALVRQLSEEDAK